MAAEKNDVADFSSKSYWEHRFQKERAFEWLQPSSTILPVVKKEIVDQNIKCPAILHVGCGTSDLSNQLRLLLSDMDLPLKGTHDTEGSPLILNIDFAAGAIGTSRSREQTAFGNVLMEWDVVDVLEMSRFESCCATKCRRNFDIVVEKSYLDALACGEEVPESEVDLTNLFKDIGDDLSLEDMPTFSKKTATIPREVLAAAYLGMQTRPGGAWIALSYSSARFDFLKDPTSLGSKFWTLESVRSMVAPSGHSKNSSFGMATVVHRPEIAHYLYTLRRNFRNATCTTPPRHVTKQHSIASNGFSNRTVEPASTTL